MNTIEKFKELYDECFDENDQVRKCGRDACKTLMAFCYENFNIPGVNYGDLDSGYMNVNQIVALHKDICRES